MPIAAPHLPDMESRESPRLDRKFYLNDDVVDVAQGLLGKVLCTELQNVTTRVIITETEAYAGVSDRASHAYGGRRTKRTEPMYAEGGIAYVYLCYGIHHLFNVVTNLNGTPHAVLVRAGSALEGIDTMLQRRGKAEAEKTLLAGPGSVAKALGITTDLTGESLSGNRVWIEQRGRVPVERITAGPRVGVDYAGEDALLPYRFRVDATVLDA